MAGESGSREQWGSRAGFILAAIGSEVGLGNMWRFSYLTNEGGGAAFLVLYLLLVATVGLPVMLDELVIGRGARRARSGPSPTTGAAAGVPWAPCSWPRAS